MYVYLETRQGPWQWKVIYAKQITGGNPTQQRRGDPGPVLPFWFIPDGEKNSAPALPSQHQWN